MCEKNVPFLIGNLFIVTRNQIDFVVFVIQKSTTFFFILTIRFICIVV